MYCRKEPLVSVVMPTYNHAQFIGQSIKSVLRQSYENIELIIIDNYSEDNTEEIVNSFFDNRIRFIKFSNKGIIASSRNLGMKVAQGQYIAFIDSDDLWIKDKLENQISVFESNSDFGLCYTKAQVINEYGELKNIYPFKGHSGYIFKKLLRRNFISLSTVMIKKEVWDAVGGFDEAPELVSAEDRELWLRISFVFKCKYINKVLGYYRVHAKNISRTQKKNPERILICMQHFLSKNDVSGGLKKISLNRTYTRLSLSYLKKKDFEESKINLLKAFKIHPSFQVALMYMLSLIGGFELLYILLNKWVSLKKLK